MMNCFGLGDWLTKEAMCFKISALQAMLPADDESKVWEKVIKVVEDKKDQIPPPFKTFSEKMIHYLGKT